MTQRDRLKQLYDTHDYENLKEILGIKLGGRLYRVIKDADDMDRELHIVHKCLTELYNYHDNKVGDIVKKYLDIIEKEIRS